MTATPALSPAGTQSVLIRVRGTVQGVGFRPNVWRLAHECGLTGEVQNDASGVLIRAAGDEAAIERFLHRLKSETPPLSRIDRIECIPLAEAVESSEFRIVDSVIGNNRTQVAPDAGICAACREETLSPFERRYRYPFTNCTHCGPRFSIVSSVPYDRSNTTMAPFKLCQGCTAEYDSPADRRFHAQPVACHVCGPKAWLEHLNDGIVTFDMHSMLDDVDAVCSLLQKGEIVAIRGIGGFHLACDATNSEAIGKLRRRKKRDAKPFALMARDVDIIERYCEVNDTEKAQLESPEAPIVLLRKSTDNALPDQLAPGLDTLGFMLPYTPLHVLVLRRMERPVVMTSANLANAPQITGVADARRKLAGIADFALFHNRKIANRVDDSLVRVVDGVPRLLRRSRGHAPAAIPLPDGFMDAPDVLAFGGELKSTFCLVKDGCAILSQHQGDLEDAETFDDYRKNLELFRLLYDHSPDVLAVDQHPEYFSTKLGKERAQVNELPLAEIQHHHAHIAACMAENGVPLDAPEVLGVALDGLGYGDDGTIWGGEFMLASYSGYRRLGTFKPVAMLGGAQAVKEPWRNTYAHLVAEMGWERFTGNFSELDLFRLLHRKPREVMNRMLSNNLNVPLASSCGRLFDAVAAAIGLCTEEAAYEGHGAMMLEAAIDRDALNAEGEDAAYPFAMPNLPGTGIPYVEPLAMWQALLGDLTLKTPVPVMAARFHRGLANIITAMVGRCAQGCSGPGKPVRQVVLTGGCYQNAALLKLVTHHLKTTGFDVLTHSRVPSNDGGLALGQAAIAAATHMKHKD